ncbi:hypothetical protein QTI24_29430 [Variovorax sp. J22P240]|uniref:hypothetical protein n=1 Tax=Variovorax sp. J22P240 TaxID=3053514 RepID=UPI0025783FDC|nr:hypothetical protein [Variovorax sp. J22P240]MDM0002751.1 hypothetical protein [Variovorax sp. J22P240]
MKAPTNPTPERQPTPAENAMKQFAKTDAESGAAPDGSEPEPTPPRRPVRPGDAGVGASSNQGSSPYQDRERPEEAEREKK